MNESDFKKIMELYVGGKTIKFACQSLGYDSARFYHFKKDNEEAQKIYEICQEYRAENMADDILAIADDDALDPARQRNMIDARKWIASKLLPKKYGDKVDVNLNGHIDLRAALADATNRLTHTVVVNAVSQIDKPLESLTHDAHDQGTSAKKDSPNPFD